MRRFIIFVSLDEFMRCIPIAGEGEVYRAVRFGAGCAHGGVMLRSGWQFKGGGD